MVLVDQLFICMTILIISIFFLNVGIFNNISLKVLLNIAPFFTTFSLSPYLKNVKLCYLFVKMW